LDQAIVLWFSQQRAQGIPVSGAIYAAQAKYFFDELPEMRPMIYNMIFYCFVLPQINVHIIGFVTLMRV
jgi:hypothetical protein